MQQQTSLIFGEVSKNGFQERTKFRGGGEEKQMSVLVCNKLLPQHGNDHRYILNKSQILLLLRNN